VFVSIPAPAASFLRAVTGTLASSLIKSQQLKMSVVRAAVLKRRVEGHATWGARYFALLNDGRLEVPSML
jgi:hypothetical protein